MPDSSHNPIDPWKLAEHRRVASVARAEIIVGLAGRAKNAAAGWLRRLWAVPRPARVRKSGAGAALLAERARFRVRSARPVRIAGLARLG
jgi:hypothetical protein